MEVDLRRGEKGGVVSVPVSVVVPVKNEEANIRACLESVAFADEVFVVDSQSTDDTCRIAEGMGAKVFDNPFINYSAQKNWALDNLPFGNDWVLLLDADERVPADLAAEIHDELACPEREGYCINRKFWFMGRWIRHCGYYPSWNLRLFRHKLGRYDGALVHEHVVLEGRVGYLKNAMLHYAYPDIATWIEKHNRYSSWEAVPRPDLRKAQNDAAAPRVTDSRLERKRRCQRLAARLPFGPALRFLYHYLLRFGFLDGYPGYVMSRLLAQYEFWNRVKRREFRRKQRGSRNHSAP